MCDSETVCLGTTWLKGIPAPTLTLTHSGLTPKSHTPVWVVSTCNFTLRSLSGERSKYFGGGRYITYIETIKNGAKTLMGTYELEISVASVEKSSDVLFGVFTVQQCYLRR